MLYALRQPPILLGLLIGFAVGIPLRAQLQQLAATAGRGRTLRRVGAAARARKPWTSYLDPYGAVAAIVAGVGWGARPPVRRGRWGGLTPLLVALAVHGALAAAGFAAYVALGGSRELVHLVSVQDIIHGSFGFPGVGRQVALGFAGENLACGLLALVPIPPLELGVLLWSALPRSPGARRFAYHLLEEAWGVAVVLVGLLLPLAGQAPALLALLDSVGDPLLRRV